MLSGRKDSMAISSPTKPTPPKVPPHEQKKGRHHPGGIISLSSENTGLMSKELSEFLGPNMKMPKEIRESGIPPETVTESLLKVYATAPFDPINPVGKENLFHVEGDSELWERIIWAICDEGEGVLASKPSDLRFIKTMGERCKVKALFVNFDRVEPFSQQAVKLFENEALKAQAKGIRVRVLILSQPHSPPARFYARDILVEYMKLCQELGIHLIVDETYAMTTYSTDDMSNPTPFTSVLNIEKNGIIDLDLCHVVHAIAKDISFFGVRYSVLISHHLPLVGAVRTCKPPKKLSTPTALSLCTILHNTEFLSNLVQKRRNRLERHYSICTHFLKSSGIAYRPACAGTAIWVDLSTYVAQQSGEAPNEQRKQLQDSFLRGGIHIARAANLQDEDESAYFKICFGMEKDVLIKGLKRLAKTLNLKHDWGETQVNKAEAGTDRSVEDLVNRLLAEHDRSPLLRSVGGVGSSDRSSGDEKRSGPGKPRSKPTSLSVARKRREFALVPDKFKLDGGQNGTQLELNKSKAEARGHEL